VILRADASSDEVKSLLGEDTRNIINNAAAHRALLKGNKVLMKLQATMTTAEAKDLHIKVLREVAGSVAVGMFDVPAMNRHVILPPKSERQSLQLPPRKSLRQRAADHH
jgi:hypothetical protein